MSKNPKAERFTFKKWFNDFLSKLLPVVTGIAITFTLQGIVNRSHDRKSVRSAMELVRTELKSNLKDITHLNDYLEQEQISAKFLDDHKNDLGSCPSDIVRYHQGMVNADVSVALSHDALELLKNSSLFQKIGDNALSMKIISAYDNCDVLVTNANRHFTSREAQPLEALPSWLLAHKATGYTDVSDIESALEAIDAFLEKR
jgi:hypothetical protein